MSRTSTISRGSADPQQVDRLVSIGDKMLRSAAMVFVGEESGEIYVGTSRSKLRKLAKVALRTGHPVLAQDRFVEQVEHIIGIEQESYRIARSNQKNALAAGGHQHEGENQNPTSKKEN